MTNEQMYDWYFEERDPHWAGVEGPYLRSFAQWPPLPLEEWRFTEMGNPRPFQSYVTTDAPTQDVASPPGSSYQAAAIPTGAGSACLADRSEPYSQYR